MFGQQEKVETHQYTDIKFVEENQEVTAQETPAAPIIQQPETPAAPVTTAAETTTLPFDEMLSKHTEGKFKSWKDVEDIVGKLDATNNELNKLREANPYANDLLKEANDYVKKGGDLNTFLRVKSIDRENLKPVEKIALELQWKYGLSPEDALLKVQSEYKIGDNFSVDENERKLLDINLSIKAKDADAYINEHIQTNSTPPAERETAERMAQWTPIVPKIADDVKSFSQKFKGTDVTLDFTFPAESIAEATKNVLENIIPEYDGLKPNEDGVKAIKDNIQGQLFWKHRAEIMQELANKFSLNQLKQTHNPSILDGDKKVPVRDDDSMDSLAAAYRAGK